MNEEALEIHSLLREAEAVGTSMEQLLAERHTMPAAAVKLQANHLRRRAAKVSGKIGRALAWDSAIEMAHLERTEQLQPGKAFPLVDGQRALEILQLYPPNTN